MNERDMLVWCASNCAIWTGDCGYYGRLGQCPVDVENAVSAEGLAVYCLSLAITPPGKAIGESIEHSFVVLGAPFLDHATCLAREKVRDVPGIPCGRTEHWTNKTIDEALEWLMNKAGPLYILYA